MPSPALAGRHVVLGVCGGIAAYKAIEVCRRLVDAGATVSPVMTRAATRFVGELTFSALASERVRTSLWDGPEAIPHTRLGQSADLILVVPATARLIGTYAAGISSDLLTATLLATRAPVVVCPAMHTEMWEHPAVTDNLSVLRRRGVHVVAPVAGRLAGGDVGQGRLADPDTILEAVEAVLTAGAGRDPDPGVPAVPVVGVPAIPRGALGGTGRRCELRGVHAVVTAGGTREPIDAVRYVGNRSSGKQGHAVAAELSARGATVTLVRTVALTVASGIEVVDVDTAAEMAAAVLARSGTAQVVVMAAAVADFRPRTVAAHKLKKVDGPPEVVLEPTVDILAELGHRRRDDQVLVGFAAETAGAAWTADGAGSAPGADVADARARLVASAVSKRAAKSADLIVANDVSADGVGFGHDTNAVVVVGAAGVVAETGLRSKAEVAAAVVDAIVAVRTTHPGVYPSPRRDADVTAAVEPREERP